MGATDQDIYDSFARLLNDTSHTPLFLEIFEDFACALLSRNPERQEHILQSNSIIPTATLQPLVSYKVRVVLPKLSAEWASAMERKLQEIEPISAVPVKYDSVDIRAALLSLCLSRPLNDEVVNAYLDLIRPHIESNECHVTTTRVLTPEFQLGPIDRNIKKILSTFQKIIVPIAQPGHWTFATMQRGEHGINVVHYDSIGRDNLPIVFKVWYAKNIQEKCSLTHARGPLQRGRKDCGVLMLMGIRLVAAGRPHLAQEEADHFIPSFRCRILAELLISHLDPKPDEYKGLSHAEPIFVSEEPQQVRHGKGNASEPYVWEDSPPPEEPHVEISSDAFLGSAPLKNDLTKLDGSKYDGQQGSIFIPEVPTTLAAFHKEHLDDFEGDFSIQSPFDSSLTSLSPQSNSHISDSGESETKSDPRVTSMSTHLEKAKQKLEKVRGLAVSYATEEAIYSSLKHAVELQRTAKPPKRNQQLRELATLWHLLEANESIPRSLQARRNRQKFSEEFLQQKEELRKKNNSMEADHQLKALIGIGRFEATAAKRWRAANALAHKASIWTELSDLFETTLGKNRFVALSATTASTTTLESFTSNERLLFLDIIRSRICDPGDQTIARLKAACDLYCAILDGKLPGSPLQIEICPWPLVDLESSFEDVVSLHTRPSRRALPKRSRA